MSYSITFSERKLEILQYKINRFLNYNSDIEVISSNITFNSQDLTYIALLIYKINKLNIDYENNFKIFDFKILNKFQLNKSSKSISSKSS